MRAGEWITLKADSYEAQVSQATLTTYPNSILANLLEDELLTNTSSRPCIRLDCCEAVAREVVSLLRQKGSYTPPTDAKLLRAVQHQLDFLGLPLTSEVRGQEVVLVPAYVIGDCYDDGYQGQNGMFVYSSSTRGWANIAGQGDQRPKQLQADYPGGGLACLASVLRAESTGAGEDLAFVVSNCMENNSTAVMINSSFKCKEISAPRQHSLVCNSAMAAAQGKLFLLGGDEHPTWTGPEIQFPFEVFDPHLNTWHQAAPPNPSGWAQLDGHAMVANQQEGMLLALGGRWMTGDLAAPVRDHILMYDVTGGRWHMNPSGCTYPGAQDTISVSAAWVDPYTIMVLGGAADATTARVDLLDLRTWRWRSGQGLTNDLTCGVGLVTYEGKALAIGGRAARADDMQDRFPATSAVRAYDPQSDSWSYLPQLPHVVQPAVGVHEACPVVMRVSSSLQ